MARAMSTLVIRLVIFFGAITGTTGCLTEMFDAADPPPSLPIHVYAQDSWNGDPAYDSNGMRVENPRELIQRAVEQWNTAMAPYIRNGKKVFIFEGFINIEDFDPSKTNSFTDGRVVVYKIPQTTREMIEFERDNSTGDGNNTGFAIPGGDVLMHVDIFPSYIKNHPVKMMPDDAQNKMYHLLLQTVIHEMGHVTGLPHIYEDGMSIMNDKKMWYTTDENGLYIGPPDIKAFCTVHHVCL
ncbi:MAG TPA: hypothetical protein VLK22_00635 [Candidatus Udaeobacter sp.]|nr:hypothetical protein [Candidatus Udaeobacter sp.]